MLDRDLRPAPRHAVQQPDPIVPCGAAVRTAGLVDDAANAFQGLDMIGVLSQRILDLGLFEHGVDAAQSVRLRVGHPIKAVERVVEIGQALVVGPMTLSFFRGQDRIIHGLLGLVAPTKVKRQQFRDFIGTSAIKFLERLPHGAMIGAAMPLEQTSIGRFLRQRMPKDVGSPFGLDTLIDEFETAELAQLGFEGLRAIPHRPQQPQRELPADDRRDLKKLLCLLGQSIDPRHHDIMDRVRHHQIRSKVSRFARVEGQLLEKKRITVALGDDFLGYQVDQTLHPKHRSNDIDAVVPG